MSRAGARSKRATHDYYQTPPWAASAMVDVVLDALPSPRVVLDPAAGDGVFGRAVLGLREKVDVVNVDIVERDGLRSSRTHTFIDDWLAIAPDFADIPDLVIGNPPYTLAQAFVSTSLDVAPAVAFLLRLGFLCGQKRTQWLNSTPLADVWPFARRPSFTGDGKTDGADYGVFLWRRGYTGPARLHPAIGAAAEEEP